MKYEKLVLSVEAFQKLTAQDLPLPIAYQLKKMTGRINEELVFFRMRYQQITGSEITEEEKGALIAELLNFETDWDPVPLRIPIDTKINLSCADINALEGLVEFYEEEDHERDHDQCAK